MWVRGLKQGSGDEKTKGVRSHPMWVRGLKLATIREGIVTVCRTLCGCVD